ncbi:MAG: hypothetical protein R2810_03620 [Flavobacteriales bacterium]
MWPISLMVRPWHMSPMYSRMRLLSFTGTTSGAGGSGTRPTV